MSFAESKLRELRGEAQDDRENTRSLPQRPSEARADRESIR
jgi:hypothetical protein